jgi:hypothetical protein
MPTKAAYEPPAKASGAKSEDRSEPAIRIEIPIRSKRRPKISAASASTPMATA